MKKNNEQLFLDLYREYEGLLRDKGVEYRHVEDNSEGIIKDRLTIMRQMRNYLTHRHDPNFLIISDKQVEFLCGLIKEESLKGNLLQNHLISIKKGAVSINEPLSSVIAKMKKLRFTNIVVYDDEKKILGRLNIYDAALMAAQNTSATVGSIKKLGPAGITYTPEIKIEEIQDWTNGVICCTEKGFLGIGVLN